MENEESEYIVLKVINEGEDEEALVTVDDEDEFNTVIKLFEAKADNAGLFAFDIPSAACRFRVPSRSRRLCASVSKKTKNFCAMRSDAVLV